MSAGPLYPATSKRTLSRLRPGRRKGVGPGSIDPGPAPLRAGARRPESYCSSAMTTTRWVSTQ